MINFWSLESEAAKCAWWMSEYFFSFSSSVGVETSCVRPKRGEFNINSSKRRIQQASIQQNLTWTASQLLAPHNKIHINIFISRKRISTTRNTTHFISSQIGQAIRGIVAPNLIMVLPTVMSRRRLFCWSSLRSVLYKQWYKLKITFLWKHQELIQGMFHDSYRTSVHGIWSVYFPSTRLLSLETFRRGND